VSTIPLHPSGVTYNGLLRRRARRQNARPTVHLRARGWCWP